MNERDGMCWIEEEELYYEQLREQLNTILKKLQEKPDRLRFGYSRTVPSILNAYREGDIFFVKACSLLEIKNDEEAKSE